MICSKKHILIKSGCPTPGQQRDRILNWRREGDLNPRGPERPQANWCPFKGASPGLLPAWLGYPGKQKPALDELICTFSLTFAEFKALSKNTPSENSVLTLDY